VDTLDQLVLAEELLAGLGRWSGGRNGRGGSRRGFIGDVRRKRARFGIGRAFGRSGGGRRFEDERVCAVGAQYRSS
jgi:hypothetical protein